VSSAKASGERPALATVLKLEMAYVLFMDIVSYSLLPTDEQPRILAELQETVRSSRAVTSAHADENLIALPTGDGMALVFFGCPDSPVTCALEVARTLRQHPEIKLRMGIHAGPVYRIADINANGNVTGGGINIAQRVMDCGDEGHILISNAEADVLSQLSAWKNVSLQDLGEVEVKHGVRIRISNLYSDEVGNSQLPRKVQAAREAAANARDALVAAHENVVASQEYAASAHTGPNRTLLALLTIILVAAALAGLVVNYVRGTRKLHDKDTIVVADFDNRSGESSWDDVLKLALTKDLQDSPYLNVLPDETVSKILKLMKRDPNQRLTRDLARPVCLINRNKAFLTASVVKLGERYHLDLRVVNCRTGMDLASADADADGQGNIIAALKNASSQLRQKLGDSLASLETPQWTSTSPEALDAYDTGLSLKAAQGSGAAVPSFKHAVELDPDFADAYAALCAAYGDLGEDMLSIENCGKAYQLRDNVKNPRERFHIEADYYDSVTWEMERANQTYVNWIQVYPADYLPHQNLAANYSEMGQHDKAIEQEQMALRIQPNNVNALTGLMDDYLAIDQSEKANSTFEQAHERKLDHYFLGVYRYYTAFLQGDGEAMQQQLKWATGLVHAEDAMLSAESDTEAFYGRFNRARGLTSQAVQSAKNADAAETAAGWMTNAAMREAEAGNEVQAHAMALGALKMSRGRDVEFQAALALARSGRSAEAEEIVAKLNAEYPRSTMVQSYWLPTIQAAIALRNKDANRAIELLEQTTQYELGEGFQGRMYPPYLRGEAYLLLGRGDQAAAEFQKILDHRGVVLNFVIGALARLQLARAAAVSGDTASARKHYEEFLELWKGADADLPVLRAARAEYSRLK